MNIDILTKQDLVQMKTEILDEIRSLISGAKPQHDNKWLRSADVRKILSISPGTLQNLRIQGLISYTKLGGSFFYHRADIEKILSKSPSK